MQQAETFQHEAMVRQEELRRLEQISVKDLK